MVNSVISSTKPNIESPEAKSTQKNSVAALAQSNSETHEAPTVKDDTVVATGSPTPVGPKEQLARDPVASPVGPDVERRKEQVTQEEVSNVCTPMAATTILQPSGKLLDLGNDLPEDMEDQVPSGMQRRLEKCHLEGFVECVKEHVSALSNCKIRK